MKYEGLLPESRLGRARLVTLIFAVLLVITTSAQVEWDSDVLVLSIGAEVILLGMLLGTAWRRRHVMQWEAPAAAVLTILVGISLRDPFSLVGICLGVILTQTLYDGVMGAVVRVVCFVPAFSVTTELSAVDQGHWYSLSALAAAPMIPLFVGLTWALKHALESQDELITRSHFLGELSGRLLGTSNPLEVLDIMYLATEAVCEVAPGLSVITIRRAVSGPLGRSSASVVGTHGVVGDSLPSEISQSVLAPLLATGIPVDGLAELPDGTRQMARLGMPKHRSWFVQPLDLPPDVLDSIGFDTVVWGIPMSVASRWLALPDASREGVLSMLRTIRRHGEIASATTVERLSLLNQAQHDDSTGLLNRSAFTRRLSGLLEGRDGPVSLVFIRLTGLIPVFARHGIGEMDSATRRLSKRLIDEVKPDAVIGRFGDFVLAVAFTGSVTGSVTGEAEPAGRTLDEQVHLVANRLAEPIMIKDLPVSVRINVGVWTVRSGDSLGDVIQRAASAVLVDAADEDRATAETLGR